jgi:hypothetical protein
MCWRRQFMGGLTRFTFNLRDFPIDALPYAIEAIHPDEFIEYQHDLDEAALVIAARTCRARLINPPRTAEEYLSTLQALGLPKTAAILCAFAEVI